MLALRARDSCFAPRERSSDHLDPGPTGRSRFVQLGSLGPLSRDARVRAEAQAQLAAADGSGVGDNPSVSVNLDLVRSLYADREAQRGPR